MHERGQTLYIDILGYFLISILSLNFGAKDSLQNGKKTNGRIVFLGKEYCGYKGRK